MTKMSIQTFIGDWSNGWNLHFPIGYSTVDHSIKLFSKPYLWSVGEYPKMENFQNKLYRDHIMIRKADNFVWMFLD